MQRSQPGNLYDPKMSLFPYSATSSVDYYDFNHQLLYADPFTTHFSHTLSPTQPAQNNYVNEGKNWPQVNESFSRHSCHSSRAYPATVTWLLDNYETVEGVSLPRCVLYLHYKQHCEDLNFPPMNQASFGKLIRSVFIGLRTRRLGTRGNSKYHYYGIRIRSSSNLNKMIKEECVRPKRLQTFKIISQPDNGLRMPKEILMCGWNNDSNLGKNNKLVDKTLTNNFSRKIPVFKKKIGAKISADFKLFEENYRSHCSKINEAFAQFNFRNIIKIWRDFWSNTNEFPAKNSLSNERFREMLAFQDVSTFIYNADCTFYQHLVTELIPNILNEMSSPLTQNIRAFAKNIETQLGSILVSARLDGNLIVRKLNVVAAFAQTLRRHTKLQHLAQSTKGVVQDISQRELMSLELSKIDFNEIQEQLTWVTSCKTEFVLETSESFKLALLSFNSLEQWREWLTNIINSVLARNVSSANLQETAQQFMLKWSLYVSMVIRDLTLRSSLSFGSFHVLRLFFDEFLHYLVENRVADLLETTPIGLIADIRQNIPLLSSEDGEKIEGNDYYKWPTE